MSSKAAGKKREASPDLDLDVQREDDVAEDAGLRDDDATEIAEASSSKPKSKSIDRDQQNKKKKRKTASASVPGIVYISRLPPGMTPQKVKHLMGRWGEVGKIYAQKRDAPTGYNPNSSKKKEKHQAANYSEAWVEFLDKSVAKTVAKMLNAQVIGGKKGDKWRDDIWTMKYLSGFKWEMLGEQVAYERQAHQARLRNEITQSRAVQGEYLRNVELARVLDKRRAKKAAAEGDADPAEAGEGEGQGGKKRTLPDAAAGSEKPKHKATYRQREVVDRAAGLEKKGMDSVLGSVFG